MKIKYYSACTDTDVIIDDKSFSDYLKEEQREIIDKIVTKALSEYFDLSFLLHLLNDIGAIDEYYDDEPCEQCGHYYEKVEWEI